MMKIPRYRVLPVNEGIKKILHSYPRWNVAEYSCYSEEHRHRATLLSLEVMGTDGKLLS